MGRFETPSADILQLRAGHFRQNPSYGIFRSRGTPNHLLIYTLSGSGRFCSARGELTTAPGDFVLFKPGTPHDYGTAVGALQWELLWTHFHPHADWHAWLDFPSASPGVHRLSIRDLELRSRIEQSLLEMVRLKGSAFRHGESLAMNKLEEVLLWCELENPSSNRRRVDSRVELALTLIGADLKRALDLRDLARRCGLSRSRFSALFREQVGTTPQRYQEAQRLARARELLEFGEMSVAQIAENLGFLNRFYFSNRFKRAIGVSPTEHRRVLRGAR